MPNNSMAQVAIDENPPGFLTRNSDMVHSRKARTSQPKTGERPEFASHNRTQWPPTAI